MPSPNYQLRPATNADAANVRDLVFTVLREFGLEPDAGSTDADLMDIERSYLGSGGAFDVLIVPDGSIVGCVGLHPVGEGSVELRKMYLLPEHRGGGLGRQLLDHALKAARELGFRRVVLETAAPLRSAIALYESYGFTPLADHPLSCRCDQAYELVLG